MTKEESTKLRAGDIVVLLAHNESPDSHYYRDLQAALGRFLIVDVVQDGYVGVKEMGFALKCEEVELAYIS